MTFIYRFDTTRTNTNDPISTALSAVKRILFDNVQLCVPLAGFDAIFDWYMRMLGRLFYFHIVKSTPCDQSFKRVGFLIFTLTFTSHLTCFKGFHIVALSLSLK